MPTTGEATWQRMTTATDLDDAVDQNGNPVTLERIHFVKVQSAILKNVESIGEVSTEVVGFKAF